MSAALAGTGTGWVIVSRERSGAAAAGVIGPGLRGWFRYAGEEMGREQLRRSCLVLAPHPDDETLGCGATILAKLAAGVEVTVAVVADGRALGTGPAELEMAALRRRELEAAAAALGLERDRLVLLGFPDGGLGDQVTEVADAIADLVATRRPSQVLVTAGWDPHPDHAALGAGAAAALAGKPDVEVLEYPIWQWAQPSAWTGLRRAGRPRLVATGGLLDAKRAALSAHASQLAPDVADLGLTPGRGTLLGKAFVSRFLWTHEIFFPGPP
ncbi:MAG: PIG-L deacetylase family protein [Acidimicrobiales bacterium]